MTTTIPQPLRSRGGHAVVVGAAMAGLFAARVLSEFYERVTILDRDPLTAGGGPRSGVPQGRHLHVLLTGGAMAIRALFPSLIEDLVTEGVPVGDVLADGRTYFDNYRLAQAPSSLPALGITRPYLEHRIRQRLAEAANVSVWAPVKVVGLMVSPGRRLVTGVRVVAADSADEQELPADLVVDASGRGSQAPTWLAGIGYSGPDEDRIPIDVAYSSCAVSLPPDALDGDQGVVVGATPTSPRGGGLVRMEQGRWLVSLSGYHGHHPPVDPAEFIDFAATLGVPDIANALRRATPLTAPVRYRVPHVTRRRYERLTRFPDGFVVLGDAATFFNPMYGQGMTVAAQQAMILGRLLVQGTSALRRARRQITRASAVAWTMSTSSDLRMPWIEGRRTPLVRLSNAYAARVFRAAHHDPAVAQAFMRVANLVDPPGTIVRPRIALRVLAPGPRRSRTSPPRRASESNGSEAAPTARPDNV